MPRKGSEMSLDVFDRQTGNLSTHLPQPESTQEILQ